MRNGKGVGPRVGVDPPLLKEDEEGLNVSFYSTPEVAH